MQEEDKEEERKLAGPLAKKEQPAEGCSRRYGKWTVWRYEKEDWEEGRVENAEFAVKDLPLGRTLWLIDWYKFKYLIQMVAVRKEQLRSVVSIVYLQHDYLLTSPAFYSILRPLYTGRFIVPFFVSSRKRQKNRRCREKSDRIFGRDDRAEIWMDSTRFIACDSSVSINFFVCSVIVRFLYFF